MKDTNEELALLIQAGKKEHIPQLWEQVQDFVTYMAEKHLLSCPDHLRQYRDDMVNQSYFRFLDAVRLYRPERGSFINYLSFHIRVAFTEVLRGRTEKQQKEPLNTAVGFDTPVEGTEGLTLADMLIDTGAEEYYRRLEDADLWRSVHGLLQDGIDTLEEPAREMFQIMLERGTGTAETLRIMGTGEDQRPGYYEKRREGLRKLRSYLMIRLSRERGRDIALEELVSYHSSVRKWRGNLFTSTVEQAVIKRNDRRDTAQIMQRLFRLQR